MTEAVIMKEKKKEEFMIDIDSIWSWNGSIYTRYTLVLQLLARLLSEENSRVQNFKSIWKTVPETVKIRNRVNNIYSKLSLVRFAIVNFRSHLHLLSCISCSEKYVWLQNYFSLFINLCALVMYDWVVILLLTAIANTSKCIARQTRFSMYWKSQR